MSRRGITEDPWETREDIHSVKAYNMEHLDDLLDYIVDANFPEESEQGHLLDLLAKPHVARSVIENFNLTEEEKFDRVLDTLEAQETAITLVFGRKRHWKSITAGDIMMELHRRTRRPLFAIGQQEDLHPSFTRVGTIQDVPRGALALWDEAVQTAGARTAVNREQRDLPGQLAVSGQNEFQLFFVTQSTKLMDPAIPAMVDNIIVKPVSMLQGDTERGSVRWRLKYFKELVPRKRWQTLFLSKEIHPILYTRGIPNWWEESYSYAFQNIQGYADAVRIASRMKEEMDLSYQSIAGRMRGRGFVRSRETWRQDIQAYRAREGGEGGEADQASA